MAAVNQVASERGIDPQVVLETLKRALLAAYRKDYGSTEGTEVEIDPESGEVKLFKEGQDVTPAGFGRIAAQTAKQVILQGVREAEKIAIIDEFSKKVGNIISGMLQRREGNFWVVDLGRAAGILPPEEQIPTESYNLNRRMKVFIKEIRERRGHQEIVVSRTEEGLIRGLFEIEVPEIASGSVEIKGIAREPGSRSKIAVISHQGGVDPVGSCVGQRGVRVQAIIEELNGEKMDIILFNEDSAKFVSASLSPAKVADTKINEKKKEAKVFVPEDQLSLAIGKEGQNVRLAAKLTGFRIDIQGEKTKRVTTKPKSELEVAGLPARTLKALRDAGIVSVTELEKLSDKELLRIKGIGPKAVEEIKKL